MPQANWSVHADSSVAARYRLTLKLQHLLLGIGGKQVHPRPASAGQRASQGPLLIADQPYTEAATTNTDCEPPVELALDFCGSPWDACFLVQIGHTNDGRRSNSCLVTHVSGPAGFRYAKNVPKGAVQHVFYSEAWEKISFA